MWDAASIDEYLKLSGDDEDPEDRVLNDGEDYNEE